eukprot:m.45597 g.45597  ORF g.45597 m.45597 type:complete len:306 (+) comp6668_c0_seq1:322-1239(+)
MWLANLTAALDLDDDSIPPERSNDRMDPTTPDVTLVGEISKFGGSILSEGGALLSEMNHHVFSGAVVDVLAPTDPEGAMCNHAPTDTRQLSADQTTAQFSGPLHPLVTKTVGLVGEETIHMIDIAQCLARNGHNLAVVGPTKSAAAAVEAFNACRQRTGRSIGVMPEARAATFRRDRQFLCEPEVPVFVQPTFVLRTLLSSCDAMVVVGDDVRVVAELARLRTGVAAVRLATSARRTTASHALGSIVKTVDEVIEHVEQLLASNIVPDLMRNESIVVDDLVCVESPSQEDNSDDDLGTYEVVDWR